MNSTMKKRPFGTKNQSISEKMNLLQKSFTNGQVFGLSLERLFVFLWDTLISKEIYEPLEPQLSMAMRSNSLKYQQKGIQTSLTRRIWRKLRGIVREVAILDDFTLQNDNGRKRGYLCTKNCPIAHFLLETYEDKGFKQAGTFPLPYAHEYREL